MLIIQTVKILVEANTVEEADLLIQNALSANEVLDVSIESSDEAAPELAKAVSTETYCEHDFIRSWLLYSPTVEDNFGVGYFSNQYGWVDKDLATRYEPIASLSSIRDQKDKIKDATLILDTKP